MSDEPEVEIIPIEGAKHRRLVDESKVAEAYRAGRIAGLSEAAEIHDAESARMEAQIAENNAYCERTGQDPNCSANWFCRNRQDYHRRSAEAIRANATKLANEGDGK